MSSVYPSTQITEHLKEGLPMLAASDIAPRTLVRIASSGDWAVQMVATTTEQPLGFTRDWAKAGGPVTVYGVGNIIRVPAGASFPRQAQIGVVGTSSAVNPLNSVTVTYPVIGQVLPGASSGANQWTAGQALESSALNDQVAVYVNPRSLSGVGG